MIIEWIGRKMGLLGESCGRSRNHLYCHEIAVPHDFIDDLANVSSGVLGGYGIGSVCNAGLRKAGIDMWARRYPNAGGGDLGIDLNGKNLGRLDWHKFGKGANVKNRPHIDIPSMKVKHWPWK